MSPQREPEIPDLRDEKIGDEKIVTWQQQHVSQRHKGGVLSAKRFRHCYIKIALKITCFGYASINATAIHIPYVGTRKGTTVKQIRQNGTTDSGLC